MGSSYGGPERRQHIREKAHFMIRYRIVHPPEVVMELGQGEFEGVMLDISEGGMALVMTDSVPKGTQVKLKWTLIDPHASAEDRIRDFEVAGEVRHCVRLREDEVRLGIAFVGIEEGDRKAIAQFIEHNPPRSGGGAS